MNKSKSGSNQRQSFKTKIVPGNAGSGKLFEEEYVVDEGTVECLGMAFGTGAPLCFDGSSP